MYHSDVTRGDCEIKETSPPKINKSGNKSDYAKTKTKSRDLILVRKQLGDFEGNKFIGVT